jgi:hypothetical protein
MMNLKEEIPHLNIEVLADGIIRLENESMGDNYVVDVHPVHLRLMAEKMGLVREVSATDAELLRDLGRYKRALLMIRDRAEQLHQNIFGLSQLGHEDMGIEVAQSAALADMTEHICIEFEGDFTPEPPQPAKLPGTGGRSEHSASRAAIHPLVAPAQLELGGTQ